MPSTAWTALAAAAIVVLVLGLGWWRDRTLAAQAEAAAVAQATEEARFALAYLGSVSRRAGLKLRDEVVVERLVNPPASRLRAVLPLGLRAAPPPGRVAADPVSETEGSTS